MQHAINNETLPHKLAIFIMSAVVILPALVISVSVFLYCEHLLYLKDSDRRFILISFI